MNFQKMKAHEKMVEAWKKYPEFKTEYNALEDEFAMFDEQLKARMAASFNPG